MKAFRILTIAALIIVSIQNISGQKPWDIILLDISSDMDAYAKNKVNELCIADKCINALLQLNAMPDSIMLFAEGRTKVATTELTDKKLKYKEILKIIGDGTAINNALASCIGLPSERSRIMIITNGREKESSVSSNTMAKLMKSNGIYVDAIMVTSGCDSIFMKDPTIPTDSVLFKRNEIHKGFKNVVDGSGGHLLVIEGETDLHQKIKDYLSLCSANKSGASKRKSNLNPELTERMLSEIKPQKINICEVDTNVTIKYREKTYKGLNEILKASQSDDHILVDRVKGLNSKIAKSLNIIFVANPEEGEKKQSTLRQIQTDASYCKLQQDTPIEILPMIYYSGKGNKMQVCGLTYE